MIDEIEADHAHMRRIGESIVASASEQDRLGRKLIKYLEVCRFA